MKLKNWQLLLGSMVIGAVLSFTALRATGILFRPAIIDDQVPLRLFLVHFILTCFYLLGLMAVPRLMASLIMVKALEKQGVHFTTQWFYPWLKNDSRWHVRPIKLIQPFFQNRFWIFDLLVQNSQDLESIRRCKQLLWYDAILSLMLSVPWVVLGLFVGMRQPELLATALIGWATPLLMMFIKTRDFVGDAYLIRHAPEAVSFLGAMWRPGFSHERFTGYEEECNILIKNLLWMGFNAAAVSEAMVIETMERIRQLDFVKRLRPSLHIESMNHYVLAKMLLWTLAYVAIKNQRSDLKALLSNFIEQLRANDELGIETPALSVLANILETDNYLAIDRKNVQWISPFASVKDSAFHYQSMLHDLNIKYIIAS